MQRSTSQTLASGPRAEQNCSTNAAISSAVVSSVIQSSKRVTYNIIIIFLVILMKRGILTRSMQMSQSSPSPDWLGLAGSGEEAISKKKTGRKFILILELCSCSLMQLHCRSRCTPVWRQSYLGNWNTNKGVFKQH